ncbi:MAG: hypothetical protein ACYDCL_19265 [Myxococcales bacterium]
MRWAPCLLALPLAACAGGGDAVADAGPPDAGWDAGLTGYTVQVGPLPVSAGTQAVYCTYLHLGNDQPIDVVGYTSNQTQGGHHLILVINDTDRTDAAPTPCSQGEALDPRKGSMVYASQIAQDSQSFPAGVGMHLPAHASLMLQTHYIDATPDDLQVSSRVTVLAGPPGSVRIPAAPLLFYDSGLAIPEGTSSATGSCILQTQDAIKVFMLAGHMHSHGINFVLDFTDLDGGTEQLYQTSVWDSPPEEDLDPPLLAQPGSTFTWTCSYFNADGGVITDPDEMCVTGGSYYPAPQGSLVCMAYGTQACVCATGQGPDAG